MASIYDKFLNNSGDLNYLRQFAYLGSREQLDRKLTYLTKLAEPETWYYRDSVTGENISIIFYYIIHTFDQCFKQAKIVISKDEQVACMNTGLLTCQGDEIFMVFTKSKTYDPENPRSNYFYFSEFRAENDRIYMQYGLAKPELATYFSNYNELYFDPSIEINLNFDHIYEDNFERLPTSFRSLTKDISRQVFNGFLIHTKKRIRRNNRIPVPQYYKDKVMFLIPVVVFENDIIVIALEKIEGCYIANTVLTLGMAYNCARLLNKPESNWLLVETNK